MKEKNKDSNFKKYFFFSIQIAVLGILCLMIISSVLGFILNKGMNIRDRLISEICQVTFIIALTVSMLFKVFTMRSFVKKIAFYVFDSIFLFLIAFFSRTIVSTTILYATVLTEFYLAAPYFKDCSYMFGANAVLMSFGFLLDSTLIEGVTLQSVELAIQYFMGIGILSLHFMMFNFAMVIWRQNRKIEASKIELLEAYHKLEEATVYQERNRIAKEIHDTAGHSLTTMIMQAESAKLSLKRDTPAYAAVTAMELQAKNCLEQLRMSIHLLSGRNAKVTFKAYLEQILLETTNSTNLTIRWKIEEMVLSSQVERLIANTLREGIANGLRHGKSTAFIFELKETKEDVVFFLSDNGIGGGKTIIEGYGLRTTREKVEELGGVATFTAHPDEGFDILLKIPKSIKKEEKLIWQ